MAGKRAYLDFAVDITVEAGRFIKENGGRIKSLEYKGDVDLVTDVDKKAQAILTDRIQKEYPDHGITAEEQFRVSESSEYRWVIDPIDGTTNFVHGYPFYCVSVALEHKGEKVVGVVYDPCSEEIFTAEKGKGSFLNARPVQVSSCGHLEQALIATGFSYTMREKKTCMAEYLEIFSEILGRAQGLRRDGSAALDLCYVACGRVDGFFEEGLKEWDTAAGVLIIEESGGIVTDFFGGASLSDSPTTLAGTLSVHREMMQITRRFGCSSL